MKSNLEKYAAEMSHKIKSNGLESYHWSEICTVIDELLKYADFSCKDTGGELSFIGYTNGANLKLLKETDYGAMYSNTKENCYIPLYMLKSHLHRIETTSNGSATAKALGFEE